MAEDLQGLLEKINREGVEKAKAKAEEIIAVAKKQAAEIVAGAKTEADRSTEDAKRTSAEYAARAEETIRQAARDTIISIETAIGDMLVRLLTKDVTAALADAETLKSTVSNAVKAIAAPAEIALPAELVPAIKAQFASEGKFTVKADDAIGSGFTVRTEGGRVEHDFTGEAIAAELARRLRPDLAKLVHSK